MEPSLKYLSIVPTMCGLSVCGVSKQVMGDDGGVREPCLYDTKQEWYDEMADEIVEQVRQVRDQHREPNECGTEEELRAVLVYPDGRIIDASDLITNYRKLFDSEN